MPQCAKNAMKLVLWNEIAKNGKKDTPQSDAVKDDDKSASAPAAEDHAAEGGADEGEEQCEEEVPELDPALEDVEMAEGAEGAEEQPAATQPEDSKDID